MPREVVASRQISEMRAHFAKRAGWAAADLCIASPGQQRRELRRATTLTVPDHLAAVIEPSVMLLAQLNKQIKQADK
jgi:hypothetical protein